MKSNGVQRTAFDEDCNETFATLSSDDGHDQANQEARVGQGRTDEKCPKVDQFEDIKIRVNAKGQDVNDEEKSQEAKIARATISDSRLLPTKQQANTFNAVEIQREKSPFRIAYRLVR